ncbi:MAG: hypothetical protein NVSMB9_18430 [Isosphaeraceae bacterium]
MSLAMRFAVVCMLFLGATSFSSLRAEEKELSGDLKKMQGTWTNAGSDGPEVTWVVKGETLKATVNGDTYDCTVSLKPDATPHPSADLMVKTGPNESAGKSSKAIYKFDGDKLVFCTTAPGGADRPTEFRMVEDQSYLFELKKQQ